MRTISMVMREMGRKGGSVKSKAKKKGTDEMRRVAQLRWERVRALKAAASAS